jgi:hypothetical protein
MPTPVQPPNARGLTAPPPPPLRAPDARADARREYTAAAAGGLYLDANYLQALPTYIDDVTRRMGGATYEQMLKDECVHSAFKTVVLSVLSEGVNVRPCVDDKDDKDFGTARDYTDECVAAFDQGGEGGDGLDLEHLASELLYSLATGWVAAEKVVGVLDGGRYDGLQCWESVRAKPRRNVTPVVDPFDRVHGYLCRMPGRALSQLQGQVVGDPTRLPNYLPADKFCHAAWDVREHDPRGQSILRPVYTRWYEKQQVGAEWLKHLAQFGSPWVVGKTAGATQGLPAVDTLGNATGDASDQVTPEQAFLNQILLFRNGGAIVVPNGWELTLLQVSNAGDAFLRKIDSCDRAITQGITLQTLATTEGEHQARAAAQVHQDTLGLVPGWVRRWLARLLTRSLVRPLVRMNHGDAAVLLAPVVKLEAAEKQDRPKLITAYAGAGWKFAPSQLPAVDEELGFEPRTPEEAQPPPVPVPSGVNGPGKPGQPASGTPAPSGQEPPPAAFAGGWDEAHHPRDAVGRFAAAAGAAVRAHVEANAGARTKDLHQSTARVLKDAIAGMRPKVRAEVDAMLPRAVARLAYLTGLPEKTFAPLLRGASSLAEVVLDHYRDQGRELLADIRNRFGRWQPEDAARALAGTFGAPTLDKDDVADAFDARTSRIVERYKDDRMPADGDLPPAEEEAAVDRVTREADQLESAVRAVLWATFNPPSAAAFAWDESQHPRGQPGNKGQFGPGGGGAGAEAAPAAMPPGADPGDRPKPPAAWESDAHIAAHGKAMAAAHDADPHVQALRAKEAAAVRAEAAARAVLRRPPPPAFAEAAAAATAASERVQKVRDALAHEARRSLFLSFGAPSGNRVTLRASVPNRGAQKENWDKAKAFLQDVMTKDGVGDRAVRVNATRGRAYAIANSIYTAKGDDVGVTVHEFGHTLEEESWVQGRVAAFREKRFDPAKDVPLSKAFPGYGFDKDEVGNPDDMHAAFGGDASLAAYAGKTYAGGHTELVSMGLEHLYRDPVRLAREDPEYFGLVVGILQRKGGGG